MFISGITQFANVNKEIEISEEDKQEFVKAILELKPFKKQFNYGPIQLLYTTPSLEEYKLLEKNPENFDYEDCFVLVALEKICINTNTTYEKGTDILENYNKLSAIIHNSPIAAFIAKSAVEFYHTFKELMRLSGEPDFFGIIQ